ncbi:DUF3889 domain-containing protein [Virgibacillus kekensis]|uniref:DUF3889 domain-containing protein n=1 Tax=Virgibacillus kekensis TaxID=202261 RepID=A0ABV9DHK8_9BACI
MRKVIILTGLLLLMIPVSGTVISSEQVNMEKEVPSYAKWGRLAMKETMAKYPNAEIVDYLHRGSQVSNDKTTQQFKLWLRENDREFGVFIDITYNTETEEVVDITFRETDR